MERRPRTGNVKDQRESESRPIEEGCGADECEHEDVKAKAGPKDRTMAEQCA